jgi:hypothetical protein
VPIAAVELLITHGCNVVHTLGNAVEAIHARQGEASSGKGQNIPAVSPDVQNLIEETTKKAFELLNQAGEVMMHRSLRNQS